MWPIHWAEEMIGPLSTSTTTKDISTIDPHDKLSHLLTCMHEEGGKAAIYEQVDTKVCIIITRDE